ncbi:hypothetical protein AVEN_215745-1, partial [Araneus ventricosus]
MHSMAFADDIRSVPVYFIWLKYISMFFYGNEALLINQWKNVNNITCTTPMCAHTGQEVLKTLGFVE